MHFPAKAFKILLIKTTYHSIKYGKPELFDFIIKIWDECIYVNELWMYI